MFAAQQVRQNQLLASLPRDEYCALEPLLEPAELRIRQILQQPGQRIRYVYFPIDSVISLLMTSESGSSVEVGIVGNRGMVGIRTLLGASSAPHKAIVEVPGRAIRIGTEALVNASAKGSALHDVLMGYTTTFLNQMTQLVVCNRLHPLEDRLCRWLLAMQDRTTAEDLRFTQEMLSNRLGVRREAVTVAANTLQRAGLITYTRGRIRIKDRRRMELSACECYKVLAMESAGLNG